MKLEHSFDIAAEPDVAWRTLLDIPRIAPCMPGAELTEIIDQRKFKGAAKVKLGPVQLQFAGDAEIKEIDDENHRALLVASGKDAKGRGSANAEVAFNLVNAGDGRTRVDMYTDLALTGSVAQYGRATGLIDEIARQLISDFASNLESELARKQGYNSSGETAESDQSLNSGEADDKAFVSESGNTGETNAVSGFGILFRSLWAMVKRLFSRT